MLDDTIIAVSTPMGFGGLGIVRISGPEALEITKKIFRPKKKRSAITPRQAVFGYLYDLKTQDSFEEAYLTYFPAPHSYTTEEVVEISCHGSPVLLEETVRVGIRAGARHARPGEFTLRAYLGGRIDIIQAEAINDIIQAVSLRQARISFRQLKGSLSKKIGKLKNQIIHILSQIEASIEFPDEGLKISPKVISRTMRGTLGTISALAESYGLGQTLVKGQVLAIIGRTNVGKSTLFNALLDQDRAIVTPYPGTTRDYLQERLRVQDSIFTLTDMAGLDVTPHPIEKEGIKKGKKLATSADGILLVLDSSRQETLEDLTLIKKYRDRKTILLFNKMDLSVKMNIEKVKQQARGLPQLKISALKEQNINRLRAKIHKLFVQEENKSEEIILHFRQKLLLEEILSALSQALHALEEGFSEEIYVEEIRKVLPVIGELTGEIQSEEVLEDIFSRFCIGK